MCRTLIHIRYFENRTLWCPLFNIYTTACTHAYTHKWFQEKSFTMATVNLTTLGTGEYLKPLPVCYKTAGRMREQSDNEWNDPRLYAGMLMILVRLRYKNRILNSAPLVYTSSLFAPSLLFVAIVANVTHHDTHAQPLHLLVVFLAQKSFRHSIYNDKFEHWIKHTDTHTHTYTQARAYTRTFFPSASLLTDFLKSYSADQMSTEI